MTSDRRQPRSPAQLTSAVSAGWGVELEPFDSEVTTCFGQTIPLIDSRGFWVERIDFEQVGYGAQNLCGWATPFHPNPFVDWLYRASAIERIQTLIDVRPAFDLANRVSEIAVVSDDRDIASAVHSWAASVMATERLAGRLHLVTGAKGMFQWAVEELLPGFSEADLDNLSTLSAGSRKRGHAVTSLDVNHGPFTSNELLAIERALSEQPSWHRERAMYFLCRDWGLRPIQLALLRANDLGSDRAGPYIWVPSVKGIRRSRLRRARTNLKKRYLTDDAAAALAAHVECGADELSRIREKFLSEAGLSLRDTADLQIPLFPSAKSCTRIRRFNDDPALRPYALHADASRISSEIGAWTERLAIPARRAVGEVKGDAPPMDISAYRFRRTKASAMVMNGHSPEDVAEALDHMTVASVRYYFSFSRELIEFVNSSHNASAEISEAVAVWSGRISSERSVPVPGEMRVSNLGVCKAREPCPHHPTVTCYSCTKFRPFREGDHRAAHSAIETLRDHIHKHGTGPVRTQVDAALVGVRAVMEAIANEAG